MSLGILKGAYAVSQSMKTKRAGLLELPMRVLFGKAAKRGLYKGMRYHPRAASPYKAVSEGKYFTKSLLGHPTKRIGGRAYSKTRQFGGVVGAAQRNPGAALLVALLAPELMKNPGASPGQAAMGAARKHLAPLTPPILRTPYGY
jgi:hypothetical protein